MLPGKRNVQSENGRVEIPTTTCGPEHPEVRSAIGRDRVPGLEVLDGVASRNRHAQPRAAVENGHHESGSAHFLNPFLSSISWRRAIFPHQYRRAHLVGIE